MKELEEYSSVLESKEGDKKLEEKLGVRLENRYNTIAHFDDPLPGESPKKELTYFEKKREREEYE